MKNNMRIKAVILVLLLTMQLLNPMLYSLPVKAVPDDIYLSDMNWESASAPGWGSVQKDQTCDGQTPVINGVSYEKAIGTHTINDIGQNQDIVYNITDMGYQTFTVRVGILDQNQPNKVVFSVLVDGVVKASHTAVGMQSAKDLFVVVRNAQKITLRVNCSDDGHGFDNSIWAMPMLSVNYPDELYLSDIDWESANTPGYGTVRKDQTCDGQEPVINGVTYAKAIGTHTIDDMNQNQDIVYNIAGTGYKTFTVKAGILDQNQPNKVVFSILVDGAVKASHTAVGMQSAKDLFVVVKDAQKITLRVNCSDDGHGFDNAIWAMPLLSVRYPDELYLSNIDWESADAPGYGTVGKDRSCDGQEVKIGGDAYAKAIGTHAINDFTVNQDIVYNIAGMEYKSFIVLAGILDQGTENSVRFTILADGVPKSEHIVRGGQTAKELSVNVEGVSLLTLRVNCTIDGYYSDNAIWAMPLLSKTALQPPQPVDMPDIIDLTDIPWEYAEAGWGTPNVNKNINGNPIKIDGKTHAKGIGTHSFHEEYPADAVWNISGMGYKCFSVEAGVDDERGGEGLVQFEILGDGRVLEKSPPLNNSDAAYSMIADITGVKTLTLRLLNGDGAYHHDWADWGSPVLYKEPSMLPAFLSVNTLYDGLKLFEDSLMISGKSTGLTDIKICMDGGVIRTLNAPGLEWQSGISVASTGGHVIKVEGLKDGAVKVSKSFTVERVNLVPQQTINLSTKSTTMKIVRENSLMAVSEFKNKDSGYNWLDSMSEVRFPDRITVNGSDKKIVWTYKTISDNTSAGARTVTLRFECSEYKLTLDSVWTAYPDSDAPVRHSLDMKNNSGRDITVYSVKSLELNMKGDENEPLELLSIVKGATTPDGIGTYYYDIENGFGKNIFTTAEYNDSGVFNAGFIPFAGIQGNGHGVYSGLEWPQGQIYIEGEGKESNSQYFTLKNGLNSDFKTDIPTGMNYLVPAAFIGCYTGGRDDGSNELTKWYADFMMPKSNKDDKYPTLAYSFWWTAARTRREWISSDTNYFRGIDILSKLGFQAGVLDIGWNPADGVFIADRDRWPNGLKKHADYAHANNMEFGVYFRPMNGMARIPGSLTSAPGFGKAEWFVSDASNATLDLGNDEAKQVFKTGLRKLIGDSGLDILRTDFGAIVGWSNRINRHKYGVDTTYWSARGFYEVMDGLFAEFPNLKWENCSCGGTLKDYKSMQYATRIQSTDTYSALDVRRTFYDASYTLPAMQILQWFNDIMFADILTDDNDYRFRSVLMGSSTYFIQLPDEMDEKEKNSFVKATQIYKEWMQPLVKKANVYHVLPRADGINWDGMQYYDPIAKKGALLVFKGTTTKNSQNVKLSGLDSSKTYHIWFEDRSQPYVQMTGSTLMTNGITFTLDGDYKSEIVYIQEVGAADSEIKAPGSFSPAVPLSISADEKNQVNLEWTSAEGAESYTLEVREGGVLIASQTTAGKKAVIDGLKSGQTYSWSVTAANRFGSTSITGSPQVSANGTVYLGRLSDSDLIPKNTNAALGVLYLDSLKIETDDRMLSANGDVVYNIPLNPALNYKTLSGVLAMPGNAVGESAKVILSTDLGKNLTMTLQENDRDRNFALDIDGASSLYITVRNQSRDVLSQSQLSKTLAGALPIPHNTYMLNTQTASEYLFSTDIRYDLMGVMSNTPKHGIFAGYADDSNYVTAYIDRQYNVLTTKAVVKGINLGSRHIALPKDFDHSKYHNLAAYRSGDTFKIYIDGTLTAVRTAEIPVSRIGFAQEDSAASYKNAKLFFGETEQKIVLDTPYNGTWTGLKPTVVIGRPYFYGTVIEVNDPEPQPLPEDKTYAINKGDTLPESSADNSFAITFDKAEDYDKFRHYSSEGVKSTIVNEKLETNDDGEQKSILKEPTNMSKGSIAADIALKNSGTQFNAGVYVLASGAGNAQDKISAVNIELDSPPDSQMLEIKMFTFDTDLGWIGMTRSAILNGFFADGAKKGVVQLQVTFENGILNVYVNGDQLIEMMNTPIKGFVNGSVGLRSQKSAVTFDNIVVSGLPDPSPSGPQWTIEGNTFSASFEKKDSTAPFDFYSSEKNEGFVWSGGRLKSGGMSENKALLKGLANLRESRVVVDIIPNGNYMNGGIYLNASKPRNALEQITTYAVMAESPGHSRDLVLNAFLFNNGEGFIRPLRTEDGSNAIIAITDYFANGETKAPLQLKTEIKGGAIKVFIGGESLPRMIVYGAEELTEGTVGLREQYSDLYFDNFSVTSPQLPDRYPALPGADDSVSSKTGDAFPISFILTVLTAALSSVIFFRKRKRWTGKIPKRQKLLF